MNNSHSLHSGARRSLLLALACAFSLMLAPLANLQAADKAAVLPLTTTFEKATGTEGAPFVLKAKNTSKESLKVSGKVLLAVVHHAMDKARVLPEQTVEAGQVLTVKDLSAEDKVILTAPGFAPLEISVPYKI